MNLRFIESICYKKGGYQLLELHQERVDRTFDQFFRNSTPHKLNEKLPKLSFNETYKVRVIYDSETIDIEYADYKLRKIEALQTVEAKGIDYRFKYENRDKIHQLTHSVTADDIIMTKNQSITDSSYANLAFWDGVMWWTPDTPLLMGVKRSYLLKIGVLKKATIKIDDLRSFEKISLINAMLDLGDLEIPITNIQ